MQAVPLVPVKTTKMLRLEREHGKPIERILADAVNETGSVEGASKLLKLPHSTTRMYLWRVGVILEATVRARLPDEKAG